MPKLRLVPPSQPGPRQAARLKLKTENKPAELVQCNRCGGREFLETKTGLFFKDGKFTGGTKALICVGCLLQGHRTAL